MCVVLFLSSSYPFMRWTRAGECAWRLLPYVTLTFPHRKNISENLIPFSSTFNDKILFTGTKCSGSNAKCETCHCSGFRTIFKQKKYWTCDKWVLLHHKMLQPTTFQYANDSTCKSNLPLVPICKLWACFVRCYSVVLSLFIFVHRASQCQQASSPWRSLEAGNLTHSQRWSSSHQHYDHDFQLFFYVPVFTASSSSWDIKSSSFSSFVCVMYVNAA